MGNITALSMHVAYGIAILIVILAWVKHCPTIIGEGVNSFRQGKVPVGFYHRRDLLGILVLSGVYYVLASGNLEVSNDKKPEQVSWQGIVFMIGLQLFMAAMAMRIVFRRISFVDWLGLKWKNWPIVFGIGPAAVVGMWVLLGLLQWAGYIEWIEHLGVEKVQDSVAIFRDTRDVKVLILMAFTATIVAPVCEEIVFRGYLYGATKRFAGPWLAALCNALIFSAVHGSMVAMLPLFVFGLILVALYEWSGSIWLPITVHLLFNGATVLAQIAMRYVEIPTNIGV